MDAATIPVDVPAFVREQIAAARVAGSYASKADLIADAVQISPRSLRSTMSVSRAAAYPMLPTVRSQMLNRSQIERVAAKLRRLRAMVDSLL